MFDGSSIAGWKAINESDMTLMPDPTSACMDPFFALRRWSSMRHFSDPASGQPYGPRSARHRKEGGDLSSNDRHRRCGVFGPEAEFFVVRRRALQGRSHNTGFTIDSIELPTIGHAL